MYMYVHMDTLKELNRSIPKYLHQGIALVYQTKKHTKKEASEAELL